MIASSIPNAFTVGGQPTSTLTYDLTPYQLTELANAGATGTVANTIASGSNVILAYFNANAATWVSSTNPLTVTVTGYPVVSGAAGTSPVTQSVTFSSNGFVGTTGNTINVGQQFYNVTAIQLQGRALPGSLAVYVITNSIGTYALSSSASTTASANAITYGWSPSNTLSLTVTGAANPVISVTNPLYVYITGNSITTLATNTIATVTNAVPGLSETQNAIFTSPVTSNTEAFTGNYYNVTKIVMVLPSQPTSSETLSATAVETFNSIIPGAPPHFASNTITATATNALTVTSAGPSYGVELAQLTNEGTSGELLYSVPGQAYLSTQVGTTAVQYNQQNGQGTTPFTLTGDSSAHALGVTGQLQYYYYTLNELAVSTNTQAQDELAFGIYNSTAGVGQSNQFQLNYSYGGTKNNMSYVSTQETLASSPINVHTGFRTEKGSEVASVTPTSLTLDMAKAQDYLQFVVGPSNSSVTSSQAIVGPIGIGQSVPGLTNVTVSNVTATCTGGTSATASCTVTGVGNLTATPSVAHVVTSVGLHTATTPLAVLDANANNASTLILVGSKYVNTVSAQVFAQNPSLDSSFGPGSVVVQAFGQNRILVAGYTAAQTVSAGNQFINDLLTAASTP